jgi:hypothetical protein
MEHALASCSGEGMMAEGEAGGPVRRLSYKSEVRLLADSLVEDWEIRAVPLPADLDIFQAAQLVSKGKTNYAQAKGSTR